MLTRRNAILAPALLAISACQRPTLGVAIDGAADSAWITASERGWFGWSPGPISHVTVEMDDDAREVQWQIGSPQTCSEGLRRVQYGALPEGFTEFVAPRPFTAGVRYQVVAANCDGNQGFALFIVSNGRVHPA